MTLADDVTLDDLIMAKDDLSGADIKVRRWAGLYLFYHVFPDAEGWGVAAMTGYGLLPAGAPG